MSARVCSTPGCPTIIPTAGQCPDHRKQTDRNRGTASQRGYNSRGHHNFRAQVLDRDPVCVCTADYCDHNGRQCIAIATTADHHPDTRKTLIDQGLNPDDPERGRGVCKPCHDRSTAHGQPGGWADRH